MNNDDHQPTIAEYEELSRYLELSLAATRKDKRKRPRYVREDMISGKTVTHGKREDVRWCCKRIAFLDQLLAQMKQSVGEKP